MNKKSLILTGLMGLVIAGLLYSQTAPVGENHSASYERYMAEIKQQQQMQSLREAAELKKLLAELGIVCDVGLVQDAQGNYKLVSVNNNGNSNNNGQPITIYVPDNQQVIIRKESERGR